MQREDGARDRGGIAVAGAVAKKGFGRVVPLSWDKAEFVVVPKHYLGKQPPTCSRCLNNKKGGGGGGGGGGGEKGKMRRNGRGRERKKQHRSIGHH